MTSKTVEHVAVTRRRLAQLDEMLSDDSIHARTKAELFNADLRWNMWLAKLDGSLEQGNRYDGMWDEAAMAALPPGPSELLLQGKTPEFEATIAAMALVSGVPPLAQLPAPQVAQPAPGEHGDAPVVIEVEPTRVLEAWEEMLDDC